MLVIESAGITDVGRKRSGNEDAFFVDDERQLYVVADGMGGHQAGEVASSIVVDTLRDYMKDPGSQGRESSEAPGEEDESLSIEANRLLSGVHLANQAVYEVSRSKDAYQGMGTTVSAVFISSDTIIAANVGDSPIYLIHDGNIELISVLHTVMAEQEALDPGGSEQLGGEFRHMLTRAMGVEKEVQADVLELQAFKDDILVISSDGLSDKVSPQEIQAIAQQQSPATACQMLVDLANERGGDDNITIIVLKIKSIKQARTGLFGFIARIFNNIIK
jgi:protein phosphatase